MYSTLASDVLAVCQSRTTCLDHAEHDNNMYMYVRVIAETTCQLTAGVHQVLPQLKGLQFCAVKEVRVIHTLAQLREDVHQTSLAARLTECS